MNINKATHSKRQVECIFEEYKSITTENFPHTEIFECVQKYLNVVVKIQSVFRLAISKHEVGTRTTSSSVFLLILRYTLTLAIRCNQVLIQRSVINLKVARGYAVNLKILDVPTNEKT